MEHGQMDMDRMRFYCHCMSTIIICMVILHWGDGDALFAIHNDQPYPTPYLHTRGLQVFPNRFPSMAAQL